MIFATPDDVTALQQEVETQIHDLTAALSACIQAGTVNVHSQVFKDFKSAGKAARMWLNEEPSWLDANSQLERGHRVQAKLQPIYDELTSAGCKAVPNKPPAPAADPSFGGMLSGYGWLVGLFLAFMLLHEGRKL
jgi:hypothetical protein